MVKKESYFNSENQFRFGIHAAKELLRNVRVKRDADYFRPDLKRSMDYLQIDRSNGISQERWIPVGSKELVHYVGTITGCVADRPIASYQEMLFPDVFSNISIIERPGYFTTDYYLAERKRHQESKPLFSGYDEALEPGKVVLDIASGEAVALMQLALRFPKTTFIGVDRLYQTNTKVFPEKYGLQLTGDDWRFLNKIPDNSVDTILSCQGVGMWGLPFPFRDGVTEEDGRRVIEALQRVSKVGTVIRFDDHAGHTSKYLTPLLEPNWEVQPYPRLFVAKKLS